MDALKKHGFAISLGILGVGAICLLYFMVLGKVWGDLAATKSGLDSVRRDYKKYLDKKMYPVFPSQKNQEVRDQAAQEFSGALREGEKLYEERQKKFGEIDHPGGAQDPSGFKPYYETEIKQLIADYQKKFPPPAEPEESSARSRDEPQERPKVMRFPQFNVPEDVQRAMKELWIAREVFKASTELEIGGLQEIQFPDRPTGEKRAARAGRKQGKKEEAPSVYQYDWVKTRVYVEMPFEKIEPLVTKLLSSDRVPLRIDLINMGRSQEAIQENVVVKEYESRDNLVKEAPGGLITEPPVRVIFEFSALDWTGPKEKSEEKK